MITPVGEAGSQSRGPEEGTGHRLPDVGVW